ncbi:MAG: permease-like cell division protein FtsX [Neisseriaceae bacterium]|nr:permease-like cell division protein FtsX [Neisseriaceae bacterium]
MKTPQSSTRPLKNGLLLHWESALQALRNFFRQPISNLLILAMLSIALMLPLTLYLVVQGSPNLLNKLNEAPQITLYLQLNAKPDVVQKFENELHQDKRIRELDFISKETGLARMQEAMNINTDFISLVDENPLPDVYIITPLSSNPQEVEKLRSDLDSKAVVETAQMDTEWLQTLWRFNQLLKNIFLFLSVTLCLMFVLQAYNTIRLQILSHKEEIEITKLLGAPSSFVRRPFLYQAALQSFFAGIISIIFAQWAIASNRPLLTEMLKPYGIDVQLRGFTFQEIGMILLLCILLGILGAWLATQKHLLDFRRQQ